MQVRDASGTFAGMRNTRLAKVQAHIPDLSHTVVAVSAQARGPLPELLAFMRNSPLDAMTGQALAQASGSGNADLQLNLSLPISDIHNTKVQGSVVLAGNEVRMTPETPALARARGTVQFTHTGFALQGVQASAVASCMACAISGTRCAAPAAQANSAAWAKLKVCGPSTTGQEQAAASIRFCPPSGAKLPPSKATSARP